MDGYAVKWIKEVSVRGDGVDDGRNDAIGKYVGLLQVYKIRWGGFMGYNKRYRTVARCLLQNRGMLRSLSLHSLRFLNTGTQSGT